jgi:hypothetical protein
MSAHLPASRRWCLAVVVGSTFIASAAAWSRELPASSLAVAVGSRVRLLAPTIVAGRLQGLVVEKDEESLLVSGI